MVTLPKMRFSVFWRGPEGWICWTNRPGHGYQEKCLISWNNYFADLPLRSNRQASLSIIRIANPTFRSYEYPSGNSRSRYAARKGSKFI